MMFAKKIAVFFIVCLATAALLAAPPQQNAAAGDAKEVIAHGVGAIVNGDKAKAEDDARASALRNAVEQVIGTMIESNVIVQNYQTLEDNIYSRTQGYVQSYQVVSKTVQNEDMVEITIRALVNSGNLQNDLQAVGLLMARKGRPRLMVLINEQNMGRGYFSWKVDMNTCETEFMNVLMEKNFPFVDRQTVMRKISKDVALAALEGDNDAAKRIATQSGAEVLITGKGIAKAASGGPAVLQRAGMISCQAAINLRAVRADDGTVIATASEQAAAPHIDRITGGNLALKKATRLAAEDLSQKILDRWQQDVYSGTTINLRLLNVGTFSDLVRFKNLLPVQIRGVKKVFQRDFSGGTALLDMDVSGTASQVAEEMALKDFSPYSVEVVSVTQNTIVAKMIQTTQEEQK